MIRSKNVATASSAIPTSDHDFEKISRLHCKVYRAKRHVSSWVTTWTFPLSVPTLAPAKVLTCVAMATLIGQLPVWIAATLATWAICWTVVSPEACQDSPACNKHLKTYPGSLTEKYCKILKIIFWLSGVNALTCDAIGQSCVRLLPHRVHCCFACYGWAWNLWPYCNIFGLSTNASFDPTLEEQVLAAWHPILAMLQVSIPL